ncbi:type II toxin-antitoxin system VapC family toxin [Luteolibacter arcticus]|uniref:Ribonuclease VapC n=1 Tax=Luteolibacter arcticus TaxID=1581411 RepID=A0ABT3GPI4_9BACT|nr:type II toxin-antitoxin system VapC family toxin [Luteolibacter arcticus]MCW1925425.1 type II toxin-antitoxin system VapC family toxin [Luteolibacter arcticus]
MKYLLDTNACIQAMRGHSQVTAHLKSHAPDDCGVSMVSVFELFAGVERCREPERESAKVIAFLTPLHLLPFDWDSALRTAAIRWELEKAGKKIGPYDLQLAGQALALDLTLVSHNVREFQRVSGLRIEDWEV